MISNELSEPLSCPRCYFFSYVRRVVVGVEPSLNDKFHCINCEMRGNISELRNFVKKKLENSISSSI